MLIVQDTTLIFLCDRLLLVGDGVEGACFFESIASQGLKRLVIILNLICIYGWIWLYCHSG